jgi:hypothetical protein
LNLDEELEEGLLHCGAGDWNVAQKAQCLPSKPKAQTSNPTTTMKQINK